MSIAQMAANIKQRQKIAHLGSEWQRYEDRKKDTVPAKINSRTQVCGTCGFSAFYKYIRCPSCGKGGE